MRVCYGYCIKDAWQWNFIYWSIKIKRFVFDIGIRPNYIYRGEYIKIHIGNNLNGDSRQHGIEISVLGVGFFMGLV